MPRYVDTFEPEPRVDVKDALLALGEAERACKGRRMSFFSPGVDKHG
jgi:hypothetical protein